jgi:hypothetical protein
MTAAKKWKLIAYKCFENDLLIWLVDNFFIRFWGWGCVKASPSTALPLSKNTSQNFHTSRMQNVIPKLNNPPSKKCYIFNPTVTFTDLDRCE